VGDSDAAKKTASPDAIVDKAEEMIGQGQLELADKFCDRALEMDPTCVRSLECKVRRGSRAAEQRAAG